MTKSPPTRQTQCQQFLSCYWPDWPQTLMEDDLQWKMTFKGRKPSREDNLQGQTTSNGWLPWMEDDLRWKTNLHWGQSSLKDEIRWRMTFYGRWPSMKYNLQWMTPSVEDDFFLRDFEILLCHIMPLWPFFITFFLLLTKWCLPLATWSFLLTPCSLLIDYHIFCFLLNLS